MIVIKKGQGPANLTAYKQERGAYYDGFSSKDDIKQALLLEQGYICAYCMRRIKKEEMTIEHYIPQTSDERLALDYHNMLGVCMGNRGTREKRVKEKDMTCDAHRGNIGLTVNPVDASTIRMIKYKSDGTIYSDDAVIDKDLNSTLNLNCDVTGVLLKKNRKEALDIFKSYLSVQKSNGKWTKTFLLNVKNSYFNSQGVNKEYRGIMEGFLEKRLSRA